MIPEGVLISLQALTPLNIALAIFGGIVFGWAFRNYWFHQRTIYLCLLFVIAFSIGRTVFVAVAGATGAGLVGTILFGIYLVSTLITRRIANRGKKNHLS